MKIIIFLIILSMKFCMQPSPIIQVEGCKKTAERTLMLSILEYSNSGISNDGLILSFYLYNYEIEEGCEKRYFDKSNCVECYYDKQLYHLRGED